MLEVSFIAEIYQVQVTFSIFTFSVTSESPTTQTRTTTTPSSVDKDNLAGDVTTAAATVDLKTSKECAKSYALASASSCHAPIAVAITLAAALIVTAMFFGYQS